VYCRWKSSRRKITEEMTRDTSRFHRPVDAEEAETREMGINWKSCVPIQGTLISSDYLMMVLLVAFEIGPSIYILFTLYIWTIYYSNSDCDFWWWTSDRQTVN